MASTNDFFMLRRYSALTARSLLYLQHQISKIENQLEDLDTKSTHAPISGLDSFDHDPFPEREQLVSALIPLLQQYCKEFEHQK